MERGKKRAHGQAWILIFFGEKMNGSLCLEGRAQVWAFRAFAGAGLV